jgi:hypothetical protein
MNNEPIRFTLHKIAQIPQFTDDRVQIMQNKANLPNAKNERNYFYNKGL